MAVLSTQARKNLPSSQFALPGKGTGPSGKGSGSYPIPDAAHARAKVRAKFPGISVSGMLKKAAKG